MNKEEEKQFDNEFYKNLVEMTLLLGRDMNNRPPLYELEKEILLKVAGANQERVARLEEVGARQMYYILGLIILVILLSISKLEMLF